MDVLLWLYALSSEYLQEEQFNVELVVQCVRLSLNPQTHHHALLLLSSAAAIFPVSECVFVWHCEHVLVLCEYSNAFLKSHIRKCVWVIFCYFKFPSLKSQLSTSCLFSLPRVLFYTTSCLSSHSWGLVCFAMTTSTASRSSLGQLTVSSLLLLR